MRKYQINLELEYHAEPDIAEAIRVFVAIIEYGSQHWATLSGSMSPEVTDLHIYSLEG